uniref:Patellin-3 n=1 Tax=Rhizophora mucronata TaxID=61149 RepID=A0A2P2LC93_RHIMU
MAEETQKPEASSAPAVAATEKPSTEEVVVEKPVDEKEPSPAPDPVAEAPEKPGPTEEQAPVEAVEAEKPKAVEVVGITQSVSYKEETTIVSELPEAQKKALDELKQLVQEAINKNEFTLSPPPPPPPAPAKEEEKPSESEPAKTEKVEEKTEEKVEEKTEERVEEKTEKKVEEKVEVKEEKPAASSAAEEPKPIETEPANPTPPPEEKIEVKEEKVEVQEEETKVEAALEKATAVDEDGAKTVEAIEETVVAASSAPASAAEPEETKTEETPAPPPPPPEEVSIWGIPLLVDERSDVILLKFLRARDFKVKDAFAMIKNTVRWRKEFGIEALLEEDLGSEYDKIVYMHGFDKEGHPVCYNAYSAFHDKELYQSCFGDEKKRVKFLRWRIQFLEKSIRKFDFTPGGISTIFQVNDLKDSPWLGRKEIRQALNLLQDNYPEFVSRQAFINVPWWYLAFNRIISPFLTQRTKSKFEFARPAKSVETLFKYIAPEQVPIQYGGLSKKGEFTVSDCVTEATVKLTSKHTVEIPVTESCILAWELRAVGWDVSYGAEFVPDAEGGYTIIVSKSRKVTPSDDPVISEIFEIGEPGKVVITVDNQTSKKKKLLYRFKTKPIS